MEEWKDINGYGGKYQISNYGNVRSFSKWSKGKILKGGSCGNPGPYRFVCLVKTGRKDLKHFYIHRLVAEHFLDNPNNYSEVNHIDGNTLNNRADNLEWCSHKYNIVHAHNNGLFDFSKISGSKHPNAKAVIQKTKEGEFVKEWGSVNQIQRETPYLASSIFSCCKGRLKTAYGYLWEYKDGKTND